MNSSNPDNNLHNEIIERRKQRSLLFHILYAVDAFDYEVSAVDVAQKFNAEYETEIDVYGPLTQTVQSIADKQKTLDRTIEPFLENWRFERIGRCTLLILRYGTWEMLYTDTPHNIIINEAIELAKCFAEKDAYKFVNGLLDKLSSSLISKDPTATITLKAVEEPQVPLADAAVTPQEAKEVPVQKSTVVSIDLDEEDEDIDDELFRLDEDIDYESLDYDDED